VGRGGDLAGRVCLVWGGSAAARRTVSRRPITVILERFADFGSVRQAWLWMCSQRVRFPRTRLHGSEIEWWVTPSERRLCGASPTARCDQATSFEYIRRPANVIRPKAATSSRRARLAFRARPPSKPGRLIRRRSREAETAGRQGSALIQFLGVFRHLAQAVVFTLVAAGVSVGCAAATRETSSLVSTLAANPKATVSPNWSGYVAVAPRKPTFKHPYFTNVTGTWTVPAVRCSRAKGASSSTVWVGLGGYASHDQEEVGTDSNCAASGKQVYYAWFELVPYLSYRTFPNITDKVSPGDTITGLVKIVSPTLVELRVQDRTRGWTFMRRITFSSQDTSTADWVVEAPADCVLYYCHEANLSNFGSVTMRNISAVGRGTAGTLTHSGWRVIPLRLVPSKLVVPTLLPGPDAATASTPIRKGRARSPAGASPGPVSRNGTSFNLKWVATATRGV